MPRSHLPKGSTLREVGGLLSRFPRFPFACLRPFVVRPVSDPLLLLLCCHFPCVATSLVPHPDVSSAPFFLFSVAMVSLLSTTSEKALHPVVSVAFPSVHPSSAFSSFPRLVPSRASSPSLMPFFPRTFSPPSLFGRWFRSLQLSLPAEALQSVGSEALSLSHPPRFPSLSLAACP